ncbi:MAG: 6,7-dimethyl-8-ribityllumazine synthase [Flavobacteriales bacterium]|nr:6,7-dimethyl-8-ribityllumazine synthase [Flavobacteriales bacterium]
MSSADKNLSEFGGEIPQHPGKKIGIVVSDWNTAVTDALYQGALEVLREGSIASSDIKTLRVPGSYELPFAAQLAAQTCDAVICLGCVIQGETRHFDFICDAVAHGVMQVGLSTGKPAIFGVLTTNNQEQALERAGGKHGNKGGEAAYTALRMLDLS